MEVMTMKRIIVAGLVLLTMLLSGCGAGTEETPTPEVAMDYVPIVSVTGEVVPASWTSIGAQTGGTVVEVLVERGDQVAAGDLLVQLDPTDAQLAVHQAEAALESAQAQLALLKVGPRPEQIAVSEAQIVAAQATVSQTIAQRDQLVASTTEAEIAAAEAEVIAAVAARKVAEDHYDRIEGKVHGWIEEEAILQLRAAEQALAAAQAQLDRLQAGADPYQVRVANAGIVVAEAQETVAQAQLGVTKLGVTAEEIAVAEASVSQAEAALEAAQVAVTRSELRAPFAGTVGALNVRVGEVIAPNQPLVTLGDLTTLRVETTDLDEIDVARVALGQQAAVTFDALPEQVFTGHVIHISPMAEPGSGGVNYTVIIEMEDLDPAIRWGMTAFVDIEVGE
jgi:multidrug efflux pump subunit AcrA (membrane-fusion protein)